MDSTQPDSDVHVAQAQFWLKVHTCWTFFCGILVYLPVCLWIMDPHSRAPKKNTSHGNEVLLQDTTHLIQRPCYQRGSPCQDPAGYRTTWRPDHRKKTQIAVVMTCLPFIRSGQKHFTRRSERGKKTRQTEEEVGRQHQCWAKVCWSQSTTSLVCWAQSTTSWCVEPSQPPVGVLSPVNHKSVFWAQSTTSWCFEPSQPLVGVLSLVKH